MNNDIKYFYLSSEEMGLILDKQSLPRYLRMNAMKNVLREYVNKTRYECLMLDSRKNYRLLWFKIFSEFQLNSLFNEFNNKDISKKYLNLLFKNILGYLEKTDKNKKIQLEELLFKNQKTKEKQLVDNIEMYNKTLDIFFFDEENCIDGHLISDFRPIIYNSATQKEIQALGMKYNIRIPDKLNSNDLKEYVKSKLVVKNILHKYSDFDSLRISQIREIAKKENIYVAITLNKQESIEYILQRYEKTKNNYKIPLNKSVYQMNIPIDQDEDKYHYLYVELSKQKDEVKRLRKSLNGKTFEEKNKIIQIIEEKELLIKKQNKELEELKIKLENNFKENQNQINKLKEEIKKEKDEQLKVFEEIKKEKEQLVLILKILEEKKDEEKNNINKEELKNKLFLLELKDKKFEENIKSLKLNNENNENISYKELIKNKNIENILVLKQILTLLNESSESKESNKNMINNEIITTDSSKRKKSKKFLFIIYDLIAVFIVAVFFFFILNLIIK